MILLATLFACAPVRVGGIVDGEPVRGASDAIFDTVDVDYGWFGSWRGTIVLLTEFPDACEVYEALYDVEPTSCDDLCEEYIEVVEAHGLRADHYWSTVIAINTASGEEGTFDLDQDLGDEEFALGLYDYDNVPLQGADACEEACKDEDLLVPDIEEGEDGELEIDRADHDVVQGRFEVEFGGDDRLDGAFSARPCDMDDWTGLY